MKFSTYRVLVAIVGTFVAMAVGCLSASAQSFAYVANSGDNTVSVINIQTNTVVATIPARNTGNLAITPDGTKAFVTNNNDSTVSVINTATNVVAATIPMVGPPQGIAITPNGAFAYVANGLANTVSVINTSTNAVVATVSVGTVFLNPNAVVITPNGAFAYVVDDHAVSIIDTATNSLVATLPIPTGDGSTAGPGVAVTPNGAFVYVSVGYGNALVVSTASNTIVGQVSTTGNIRGSSLGGIAFTPNGAFGYGAIGGFNEVAVFNTSYNVVATVPVGNGPLWVAITPDGHFAYVTNYRDNTVSVINIATNAVVTTVPVGRNPYTVAIAQSVDDDSAFSKLSGGNLFNGNQTVDGAVAATSFTGNGAGLTGVTAQNALAVNGIPGGNFARLDVGNGFNGNQSVNGDVSVNGAVTANSFSGNNVAAIGSVAIGGGTPILQHLSTAFGITATGLDGFGVVGNSGCASITLGFSGVSEGDSLALGVPNNMMTVGNVIYSAWVSAANTITLRLCNMANTKVTTQPGIVRVDVWKH